MAKSKYISGGAGRVAGVIFSVILLLVFAVFLGLVSVFLPPQLVLMLVLLPVSSLIAVLNTELALVVALAAVYGIIPAQILPSIPVGGAVLQTGEILLLMLGGLVLVKLLYRSTPLLKALSPLRHPLILLAIVYFVSVIYSVLIKNHAFGLAETRNILGWSALLVALYGFLWRFKRLELYLRVFAILVAVLLVAQTVSGVTLIHAARSAESISKEFSDVIRSSAGASSFLMGYALFYSIGRAALARSKILWVVLVNLLVLGFVVTFTRGLWMAVLAGGLLFFFMTRAHRVMMGAIVWSLVFGLVLGGSVMLAKPRLAAVVSERFFSVADEGARGTSVGFRLDENRQAMQAIVNNPLIGVGIGGEYKQKTGTRGTIVSASEFTYIHNSYLGLAVKLGLIAVLVPFWLWRNVWREWARHRPAPGQPVSGLRLNIAAAISALAMFMVNAVSQPEWLRLGGLVAVSILLAMIMAASWQIDQEEGAHAESAV